MPTSSQVCSSVCVYAVILPGCAEALAHNSIGVSYQYLQEYEKALFHHESHRDVSDLPGQFIALTNMGCVYLKLDKPRHAEHHLKQVLDVCLGLCIILYIYIYIYICL